MQVEFCMFTNEDGDDVYVNPLLVRYFVSSSFDEDEVPTTRIVFDDEHSIIVVGSTSTVEEGLTIEE